MRRWWPFLLFVLVGSVAMLAWGLSGSEDVELAAIGAGATLVGSAVGLVVLRLVDRKSMAVQVVATSMVALVPVALGAWIAARAMFLSQHDLSALAAILVGAGAVGFVAALSVGRRVGRASGALIEVARRIGSGEKAPSWSPAGVPLELVRLYDELEAAASQLSIARMHEQALESSRRELVAWVSHDLRTPLAGIRAVAEALEEGVVRDPETVARYYTTLRIEADRLSGLVDDLFELSRAQAGMLRLDYERVPLSDLVSDALAGASALAEAKGVRLVSRLHDRSSLLRASESEILRALRNILENAIRHTPSDGTVIVEAGTESDHAYISVRDSGGGIAARDLPRVFDVAFSGDTARSPGTGAGLGLAIARGFVEAHRGEITVCNEIKGACFTVRLPITAEPHPS